MIEWGPFGENTQRKNKPGIDFKSIPGSLGTSRDNRLNKNYSVFLVSTFS